MQPQQRRPGRFRLRRREQCAEASTAAANAADATEADAFEAAVNADDATLKKPTGRLTDNTSEK